MATALLGIRDSNPNLDIQSVACCRLHQSPTAVQYRRGTGSSRPAEPSDWSGNICSMTIGEQVARLLERGVPPAEIARQIRVAPATVDYHVARLTRALPELGDLAQVNRPVPRKVNTRERVAALLADGWGRNAIARELGVTRSTVTYHARRLGEEVDARCARRYDWDEIQRYYDAGHSVRDCQDHFGFSRQTWHAAVNRGAVVARPHALPLDQLLTAGVYRSRFNLKLRLVRAGLKQKVCENCGIASWNGRPITLALHHVNGDRYDHRIENLQLLCPNCHSQTDTFAGRNGHNGTRPSAGSSTG
jgi:DNA-binding CsgD family transcriptional regulator